MLPHERLDVYHYGLKLVAVVVKLSASIPRGYAPLGDQLRRAAISVPLNIAEGYGRHTPTDRRAFYVIARGSANECAAILDVLGLVGVDATERDEAKEYAGRIGAMLTRLGGF
jgi:four helix bundle protein